MCPFVLITAMCTFLFVVGDKDERQIVCVGKEFRLPVYSTLKTVTFTPSSPPGPRRVLLHKTTVKDERFEWTKDRELVLKEVTHSDQGLYAVRLYDMAYEVVHLTVSECVKSYVRSYGQNFEQRFPLNSSVLEFSPRDSPPGAAPVVLWNSTATGERGRLIRDGKVWQAERVTQADQGNYTIRDWDGEVLSRSSLIVRGRVFNVTRFTKDSLNLPLFLPVPDTHLIFTPTYPPNQSFDPKPPLGPVKLIEKGRVLDRDIRYKGLMSVGRNGSNMEVLVVKLTFRHDGVYEIRDNNSNLVSSTRVRVVEKPNRWRTVLKSITVPSSMFLSLTGVILFLKRYPHCSISKIISGLRARRTPPHPRVNIQDYSQPSPEPSGVRSYCQQPGTPRKQSPRASPAHTGYIPVRSRAGSRLSPVPVRTERQEGDGLLAGTSGPHTSAVEHDTFNVNERKVSFSLAGASDCLHSQEGCVQFEIKNNQDRARLNTSGDFFCTLPLDTDTSESCNVYTSDKLKL